MKDVVIREGLKPGGFADGEVTDPTVRPKQRVLSAGHAVVTGLKSLGGLMEGAVGVPLVSARPRE